MHRPKASVRRRARRARTQRRYVHGVDWCELCDKEAYTNHSAHRLAESMRSTVEVYPCPANRRLGWFHVTGNLTRPLRRRAMGDDSG